MDHSRFLPTIHRQCIQARHQHRADGPTPPRGTPTFRSCTLPFFSLEYSSPLRFAFLRFPGAVGNLLAHVHARKRMPAPWESMNGIFDGTLPQKLLLEVSLLMRARHSGKPGYAMGVAGGLNWVSTAQDATASDIYLVIDRWDLFCLFCFEFRSPVQEIVGNRVGEISSGV